MNRNIPKLTALLLTAGLCGLTAACGNKYTKSEPIESKTIISKTGIEMVWIEPGTFMMGSPTSEPERKDNETQHQVTLTKGFYMGKYEITQEQYEDVMGTNPSYFSSYFGGDNLPVETVSLYDAVEYCNKLSLKKGLTPAYTINGKKVRWNRNANGYRLPTEAEWEYACRAGTTTPFNTGNNITTDQANYFGSYPYNNNPEGIYREKTTPAGSFSPNAWGLYDMHGNVFEWCWDWYGDYSGNAETDPTGTVAGTSHVVRGGAWDYGGWSLRSAYRNSHFYPSVQGEYLGFRVVRSN